MNLQKSLEEGIIIKINPNRARANNLFQTAQDSFDIIATLGVNKKSARMITRDLYECLRQTAQAKGYEKGYHFKDHTSIQYFLDEALSLPKIAKEFDRLRKIRNGINYYGDSVSIETAKKILEEIPIFMSKIKNA
ncbi:MAG: hypothetical protein ACOCQG_06335 [Candidatus Nanoarchaeia archaeon]